MLTEVVYHRQEQRKISFLNSYVHVASVSRYARSFRAQLLILPPWYHTYDCIFLSVLVDNIIYLSVTVKFILCT